MKTVFYYKTSIGEIGIAEENQKITDLFFETEILDYKTYLVKETELISKAYRQLREYMCGNRKSFCLPLDPVGTDFRKKVWRALSDIPYGETRSYKDIAQVIGNPNGSRAVGMANNKNPLPIFIPCHRVIGANGKLIGYGGGLEIKEYLLNLERRYRNY